MTEIELIDFIKFDHTYVEPSQLRVGLHVRPKECDFKVGHFFISEYCQDGSLNSQKNIASHLVLLNILPGSPYRRGRISTVDLLVLTS